MCSAHCQASAQHLDHSGATTACQCAESWNQRLHSFRQVAPYSFDSFRSPCTRRAKRMLLLSDNMVTVLVLEQGRSRVGSLNRRDILAAAVEVRVRYAESCGRSVSRVTASPSPSVVVWRRVVAPDRSLYLICSSVRGASGLPSVCPSGTRRYCGFGYSLRSPEPSLQTASWTFITAVPLASALLLDSGQKEDGSLIYSAEVKLCAKTMQLAPVPAAQRSQQAQMSLAPPPTRAPSLRLRRVPLRIRAAQVALCRQKSTRVETFLSRQEEGRAMFACVLAPHYPARRCLKCIVPVSELDRP